MIFDINQVEFPSQWHQNVWKIGKSILPLEITLSDITDEETIKGCTQIYDFTQDIIADMYYNPANYTLENPSYIYTEIFNRFLKYHALPDQSGLSWVISRSEFERGRHNFGCFPDLYKFGFKISESGENIILHNTKYSLFLKYWYLLRQSAEKRGANVLSYVGLCDFRLFAKTYKRPITDLMRTLSDQYKPYFQDLSDYAIGIGAKLGPPKYYHRYSFMYKHECVLTLDTHPLIVVPYGLKKDWDNSLDLFLRETESQTDKDALIGYIQQEICVCRACSDRGCWHLVEIGGAKRKTAGCHLEISKAHKPPHMQVYTEHDIQMMKRMIDIRFAQIDSIGK